MSAVKILPYTSQCECGYEVAASNLLTRFFKKLWHDVTHHPKEYKRWFSKKQEK